MPSTIVPVILAGGVGSRLWPLSRSLYPKQFLNLADPDKTLLQLTLERARAAVPGCEPIVICNEEHRFLVAEQARQIKQPLRAVILEPTARNTAPAVAVAANALAADDVMLVLPADHMITDVDAFSDCVKRAVDIAETGALVTLGVQPTSPETGYGYIKASSEALGTGFRVEKFVEKPALDVAKSYLEAGSYSWNSGMFVFRADALLRAMQTHAPDIASAAALALESATQDLDFTRLDTAAFESSPSDSIDYAVMEKTNKAAVVPFDAGWNDVGGWGALWEVDPNKDSNGNATQGDVMLEDSHGNYVRAGSRLVATVGVNNLVIVETSDAVLVADRDRVQDVKAIVNRLNAEDRDEAAVHKRALRPWGSYEGLAIADRFQVKRITVKPGATLSLQMHHHRAEHWTVVQGTARVTCGDKVFLMKEDESCYIPLGEKHRIENPGKVPLEFVEVQTGSYLGEDDIVRFEDKYGRTPDAS